MALLEEAHQWGLIFQKPMPGPVPADLDVDLSAFLAPCLAVYYHAPCHESNQRLNL